MSKFYGLVHHYPWLALLDEVGRADMIEGLIQELEPGDANCFARVDHLMAEWAEYVKEHRS